MKKKVLLTCSELLAVDCLIKLNKIFDLYLAPCSMGEDRVIEAFADAQGIIIGGEEVITERISSAINPEWIVFLGIQPETSFDVPSWERFKNMVYPTGGGRFTVAETTCTQIERFLEDLYPSPHDAAIAVIGAGSIGKLVLEGLAKYHENVIYAGGRGEKEYLKAQGFRYVELKQAMSQALVSTIHLEFIPSVTENLITEEHLMSIPRNGLLLNNARAGIVDFKALQIALRVRKDLTIIFDTFYPGHDPRGLNVFPNFSYTGHSAAKGERTYREYGEGLMKLIRDKNLVR